MTRFDFEPVEASLKGKLFYRRSEHSFDFQIDKDFSLKNWVGEQGVASMSLGTLQIEIGIDTGLLLYVWGFHPQGSWKKEKLSVIEPFPGLVKIQDSKNFKPGVAYDFSKNFDWKTFYDPSSGWIQLKKNGKSRRGDFIEFATGCIAQIHEQTLVGLLLRPIIEN